MGLYKQSLSFQEIHRVKQSVFLFLKCDPRGRNGATPLHLACAKDSSSVGRYPICQFPSLDAIKVHLQLSIKSALIALLFRREDCYC